MTADAVAQACHGASGIMETFGCGFALAISVMPMWSFYAALVFVLAGAAIVGALMIWTGPVWAMMPSAPPSPPPLPSWVFARPARWPARRVP